MFGLPVDIWANDFFFILNDFPHMKDKLDLFINFMQAWESKYYSH